MAMAMAWRGERGCCTVRWKTSSDSFRISRYLYSWSSSSARAKFLEEDCPSSCRLDTVIFISSVISLKLMLLRSQSRASSYCPAWLVGGSTAVNLRWGRFLAMRQQPTTARTQLKSVVPMRRGGSSNQYMLWLELACMMARVCLSSHLTGSVENLNSSLFLKGYFLADTTCLSPFERQRSNSEVSSDEVRLRIHCRMIPEGSFDMLNTFLSVMVRSTTSPFFSSQTPFILVSPPSPSDSSLSSYSSFWLQASLSYLSGLNNWGRTRLGSLVTCFLGSSLMASIQS